MLETLRNALLIALLLLLVYVLYKRMLNALGKDQIRERYVYFTEDSLQSSSGRLVGVEVKTLNMVSVDVYRDGGDAAGNLYHGNMEPGLYHFDLDTLRLSPGRYYCKLSTGKQEDSLYFNVS